MMWRLLTSSGRILCGVAVTQGTVPPLRLGHIVPLNDSNKTLTRTTPRVRGRRGGRKRTPSQLRLPQIFSIITP
jgi:hypothetical protein